MKFFNKNILNSIGIVLFLFLIKYSLFLSVNKNKIDTEKPPTQVSENLDVSQETWKTFINKKFSYSFKYPSNLEPEAGGPGDWGPIEQGGEVAVVGSNEYFKVSIERKLNKDLKQYVEQIWDINKSDKNPNFPNRKISNIDSFELAGLTAYKFSSTDAFSDFYSSEVIWGGENQFIFLENGGLFFRIQCGIDVVSQKILDTFTFTDKIKPDFSQSKSLTFNNDTYGFSFEYPDIYQLSTSTNDDLPFYPLKIGQDANSVFDLYFKDNSFNRLVQSPDIHLSIIPASKYTRQFGLEESYYRYNIADDNVTEHNSGASKIISPKISSSNFPFYVLDVTWEWPQNIVALIRHRKNMIQIVFNNYDTFFTREEFDGFINNFVNSFKLK